MPRSMNRGVRLLTAVLALFLAAPVAPGAAETTTGAYATYEIVRVKRGGPALLGIDVSVSHGNRVAVGALALLRSRGRNQIVGGFAGELWTNRASLYAAGNEVPVECAPGTPCLNVDIGVSFRLTASTRSGLSFVVAGPADSLRVKLSNKYWKARKITGGSRVVAGEDTALGATAQDERAEVFRSATAPGGKYGSLVVAQLPCGDREAYGSATFTGDGGEVELNCGTARDSNWMTYTHNATTWNLDGTVVSAGAEMSPTRLFVIDVPK